MTRVLVVEDEADLRNLVADILMDTGYDVTEAVDGGMALEKARSEQPDIILLDVMMPVMDGFEVLTELRQNPDTRATPVVMLTAFPAAKGELRAWRLGARHYIRKPFDPDQVELTVRVALGEAGIRMDGEAADDDTTAHGGTSHLPEPEEPIGPGKSLSDILDEALGGDIPHGSLNLIEGPSSAGKSVLCQHLAYECLVGGRGVAYITSDSTATGLSNNMESIGLNVSHYLRAVTFQIFPLELKTADPHPELSVEYLAQGIERLPGRSEVIIVDSITDVATDSQEGAIISFFSRCKRLCSDGRTVILAVRSDVFEDNLLTRLRALCDAHFNLSVEKRENKLVKVLEVGKVHDGELNTDNVFGFEVVPEIGMRATSAFDTAHLPPISP